MTARRVVAAGALVLTVALAPPAKADHTVRWGAGSACASASPSATTTVDEPVPFVACVTLGGAPLARHPMSVRIVGPERTVELDIVTGDDGIARFGVQPTAAGETTVSLCDDDGCVYGETVLTVAPPPTSTSTSALTQPTSTTVATDDEDDGTIETIVGGAAAVAVVAMAVLLSRRRRPPDVPVPAGLDGAFGRDELKVLAALDPDLLRSASIAAGAAPDMAPADQLEFFLHDVHRRVDAEVHRQMARIERLGRGEATEGETQRLKHLLDSRARLRDLLRE